MNLPMKLTVSRIVMIPLFVAVFMIDFSLSGIIATAVFIIAAFTDFLDGYLARKNNQVTDMGKFLDPIADKILVMSAMTLLLTFGVLGEGRINLIIGAVTMIVMLARELTVSALRMMAAGKGVVIAADKWGKYKTVSQDIALPMLMAVKGGVITGVFYNILYYAGLGFLILSAVLTVISGINYLVKNKEALK